jgi:hypothetical protein
VNGHLSSGHYLDGFYQVGYEGTSANIVNQFGAVCDTDQGQYTGGQYLPVNTSSAWSMIGDGYAGGGIAQSGFFRWYGSPDHFFAEDAIGLTQYLTVGVAPSYNERHHYWEQYDPGCSCIREIVDLTIFQNDYAWPQWHTPWYSQWFGETHYTASDMPGTPSALTLYSGLQGQIPGYNFWVNTGSETPANQYPNRYTQYGIFYDPSLLYSFYIWTYNCYNPC